MRHLTAICLFIGIFLLTLITVGAFLGIFSFLQAGLAICFWAICTIFTSCNLSPKPVRKSASFPTRAI